MSCIPSVGCINVNVEIPDVKRLKEVEISSDDQEK
jgi:hypothetical protein